MGQIKERERQQILAEEARERENQQMLALMRKYEADDEKIAEKKKAEVARSKIEILESNAESIRRREESKLKEIMEMESLKMYQVCSLNLVPLSFSVFFEAFLFAFRRKRMLKLLHARNTKKIWHIRRERRKRNFLLSKRSLRISRLRSTSLGPVVMLKNVNVRQGMMRKLRSVPEINNDMFFEVKKF